MRPDQLLQKNNRGDAAVGAPKIPGPASAAALAAGPLALLAAPAIALSAAGHDPSSTALQASASAQRIPYGGKVLVKGTAPSSDVGQTLDLDFEPARSSSWQTLTSTSVGPSGRFRLAAPLRQSGLWKVTSASGGQTASTRVRSGGGTAAPSGTSEYVSVAAELRVPKRQIGAKAGQPVYVRGELLPAVAGRTVRLEGLSAGGWKTLAFARTDSTGEFQLQFAAGSSSRKPLRVRFAGDQLSGWSSASAGALNVYQQTLASWYDDGGATACGFHAYYGVANKELPCGTKVAFRFGGKRVTAVVDDRGPFEPGREWDLNQNTAAALGFGGVGMVWSAA